MKHWRNINVLAILLLPFSLLYFLLSSLDLKIKKSKAKLIPLQSSPRIIVVGNITAGGTGKTPFIQMLTHFLLEKNLKVGIVSRGYGGKPETEPFLVSKNSQPLEVGDEALMHAQSLNVPVVIAKKRNLAVEYLKDNYKLDVILSDDGLQHLQMPRHLNIVLLDGLRGLENGLLLPAGPLRQSKKMLEKVDFVFCKGEKKHPSINEEINEFKIENLGFFDRNDNLVDLKDLGEITVVSAIANPESFYQLLTPIKPEYSKKEFVDHHVFTKEDFEGVKGVIVMTQKDFVKCQNFSGLNIVYCKIKASLPVKSLEQILKAIN